MDHGYAAHVSNWDDVMLVLITGFAGTVEAAMAEQLCLLLRFIIPYVLQTQKHI